MKGASPQKSKSSTSASDVKALKNKYDEEIEQLKKDHEAALAALNTEKEMV